MGDAVTLVMLLLCTLLVITNCSLVPRPVNAGAVGRNAQLTSGALLKFLKPCVRSHADVRSDMLNRLSAVTTLHLRLPLQCVRHCVAAVPWEGEHEHGADAAAVAGGVPAQ